MYSMKRLIRIPHTVLPRLSIRNKLIIAFTGLSVVPLLLVGIHGIFSNVKMMENNAIENLAHDVQTVRWQTANFLSEVEGDLRFLRNSPRLEHFVSSLGKNPAKVPHTVLQEIGADFLSIARTKGTYYQLRILDAEGNELLRVAARNPSDSVLSYHVVPADKLVHDGASFYSLLTEKLSDEQIAFVPAELLGSEGIRVPVISFAMPLFAHNKVTAILVGNVFAKGLFNVLEGNASRESNGKILLVDSDGHFLYHSDKKKDWNRLLASREEDNLQHEYPEFVTTKIFSGSEGTITKGIADIISYAPLFPATQVSFQEGVSFPFSSPLFLIESVPRDTIMGPVRVFAWTFAGVLLLFLAVAFGLGILATQQFARPIATVQRGAEIIANGDYRHRLNITTGDEIEKLAEQFNSMAASLEKHEVEIQLHRTKLEEMVQQRTGELTEEKIKLQALLDNVPSAFVMLDREFRIQTASAAFSEITGKTLEEVEGQDCHAIFCQGGFCKTCVCEKVLLSGKLEGHVDALPSGAGGERFIEHIAVPKKENGEITTILEIITDVTTRKRLEQNLIRTEKLTAAGEISVIIAHEFRNALTSIKMILQLQQESKRRTRAERRSLAVALSSLSHLENVVSELLNFARPSPMLLQPSHPKTLIEESLAFVRPRIAGHKIRLKKSVPPSLPPMMLDGSRWKEAIINLLLNAIQAIELKSRPSSNDMIIITAKGMTLRKTLRDRLPLSSPASSREANTGHEDGEIVLPGGTRVLRIAIRDTGPGIAQKNLHRIFDPFFTTKSNGTGLGLPMVKRTVNEHGGVIDVTTRAGRGTTFNIYVPIAKESGRETDE
jgi:PAS domain S-box-containing protein